MMQLCPKCKRGEVLEWACGYWCSRRYEAQDSCAWMGEPCPGSRAPIPEDARRCTATAATYGDKRCARAAMRDARLCWQHARAGQ